MLWHMVCLCPATWEEEDLAIHVHKVKLKKGPI